MFQDEENHKPTSDTESVGGDSSRGGELRIKRIGHFTIKALLGSGGMGSVYHAYDESMRRDVALKVLHPSLEISSASQSRFAREAWIAGQLDHPNIVKVFERGEHDGINYFSMEYIEGGTLAELIRKTRTSISKVGHLADLVSREYIDSILHRFIELCGALEYVHAKGFIHRDIKPHNILVSGDGDRVLLSDFGIARAQDMTRITRAGDFIGTVQYMSPELIAAHRAAIDARSDVYSLGVSLYEAITLALPFEGESQERLLAEILAGHVVLPRRRMKNIPRDLETVICKAIDSDPARRYAGAADLAEDLRRFLNNYPILARKMSLPGRMTKFAKRHRQVLLWPALLLATVVVLVAWFLTTQEQAQTRYRLLSTLKEIEQTGLSPYEIAPDWAGLAPVLAESIHEAKDDSVLSWFLRANGLFDIRYPDYGVVDDIWIEIAPVAMGLLDEVSYESYSPIVQITTFEFAAGDNDFDSMCKFAEVYRGSKSSNLLWNIGMKRLTDKTKGQVDIRIRRSAQYYANAGLAMPADENYPGNAKDGITGDSLLVVRQASSAVYFPNSVFDVYRVLDAETLTPAQPVYGDTVVDTCTIFLIEEYPDGFPMAINKPEIGRDLKRSIDFTDLRIVKIGRGMLPFRLVFIGSKLADLPVPVAGNLSLVDNVSGERFNIGSIRIGGSNERLSIALGAQSYGASIRRSLPGGAVEWHVSIEDLHFWNSFESLAQPGGSNAVMTITPSLDIARHFGDVTEYWNDTLVFQVRATYLDSSRSMPH